MEEWVAGFCANIERSRELVNGAELGAPTAVDPMGKECV